MSQQIQNRQKFLHPELFLSELLKKSAQGKFQERDESINFLYRAIVVAVDTVGGQLENDSGDGSISHEVNGKKITINAQVGPKNPRNSIKARLITEGLDQFSSDDELRVFWPFFPEHLSLPIKPEEHVYVLFEDNKFQHGLWISKLPGHENVNFFEGQKSFNSAPEQPLTSKFNDTQSLTGNDENVDTDENASERLAKDGRLTELF